MKKTFFLFSRINNPATQSGAPQDQILLAVSHLVGSVCGRERDETGLIPACLNLSASQREILKSGICSYLLPRHEGVQQGDESTLSTVPAFDEYVSPEVMKVCLATQSGSCILRVCHITLLCYTLWVSTGL